MSVLVRIDAVGDNFNHWLNMKPRYGLTKVSDVSSLVREHLLERAKFSEFYATPGPFEWATRLRTDIGEWRHLTAEELGFELDDFNFQIGDHLQLTEYCIETFHELLEEEHSANNADTDQIQQLIQQRLRASMANR